MKKISVFLLCALSCVCVAATILTEDARRFADEYMPKTIALVDKFEKIVIDDKKMLDEMYAEFVLIGVATKDGIFENSYYAYNFVRCRMKGSSALVDDTRDQINNIFIKYISEILDTVEVSDIDAKTAKKLQATYAKVETYKAFSDARKTPEVLPGYLNIHPLFGWIENSDVPLKKGLCFRKIKWNGELYYIGVCEVTQAEYLEVMGKYPSNFKGADLPVECVSWDDAMEFCKIMQAPPRFKVTLPTSEQWEFAAKGGADHRYSGSSFDLDEVGWYKDNSGRKTHSVGTKAPNGYGLYDMSGNVWEWCLDEKKKSYGVVRVIRGGSCDDNPNYCEVSSESNDEPNYRSGHLGFRVCLVPSSN